VAALAAAKLAAEQSGRDGEALAWVHLQKMKDEGSCTSIEWTSKENAVSPFDFQLLDSSGITVRIDAKSTAGDFARVIHMSVAELMTAADGQRYDLWRIYEITDEGARLRVSRNIGAFSKSILDALVLPAGVTVDSVSIDPAQLEWSSEIAIVRPDDAT